MPPPFPNALLFSFPFIFSGEDLPSNINKLRRRLHIRNCSRFNTALKPGALTMPRTKRASYLGIINDIAFDYGPVYGCP
jgi:hypothetical protein